MKSILFIEDGESKRIEVERIIDLDEIDHVSILNVEEFKLGLNAEDWMLMQAAKGDLNKIKQIINRAKEVSTKYYDFMKSGDLFLE